MLVPNDVTLECSIGEIPHGSFSTNRPMAASDTTARPANQLKKGQKTSKMFDMKFLDTI